MTARRLAAVALGLCAAAVITGCGAARSAPAAPSPPRVPGEAAGGPDMANVTLPDFTMPLVTGSLSMPNPSLTPGAVSSTSTTVVCSLPDHLNSSPIPTATQDVVYHKYGYTNSQVQAKYDIDYLVPILLGGATTIANMWPASYSGTGFFEKTKLDYILRDLVCHRTLPLVTAQRDLEKNWYVAWLKYVVATGRA
jgi:hypothetical protein